MVSKRKRNHIQRAMSKSKGVASQILLQEQEQKPTFHEDEFTIHKPIEKALRELVIRAREIEVNKKQLVNSVAYEIENELKKMNRSELICHISDVMLSALRRNKVNWSIAYLRKTLPEKYKDPTKRQSALTRFQRAGPPGTAPDTGKTTEELQEEHNRKVIGDYIIKSHVEVGINEVESKAFYNDNNEWVSLIPLVVKVYPSKRSIDVSVDWDGGTQKAEAEAEAEKPTKSKSQSKSKSKLKLKQVEKDKEAVESTVKTGDKACRMCAEPAADIKYLGSDKLGTHIEATHNDGTKHQWRKWY